MKKVLVFIPSYNAGRLLEQTIARIPTTNQYQTEILVSDDASPSLEESFPPKYSTVYENASFIRQRKNLGYGGNQKFGFKYAFENDFDCLVLLHGDGQYAPEMMYDLVNELFDRQVDMVFGSRMKNGRSALRGGMPRYKYIGNRILSFVQNVLAGQKLSEWHSGYRVYRIKSLRNLPLKHMSNGFDFDTQIILSLVRKRYVISEIPIPTYYGDEISHVNGIRYASQVVRHCLKYWITQLGFTEGPAWLDRSESYPEKKYRGSSHEILKKLIKQVSPLRVLDIGCGDAPWFVKEEFNKMKLVGVDQFFPRSVKKFDEFVSLNLDVEEFAIPVSGQFDLVVLADVLEHLRRPEVVLERVREILEIEGKVLVSLPNFNHWYPRLRILVGMFGYDQRGILDSTHYRFFTPRTAKTLFDRAGFEIERLIFSRTPGTPLKSLPLTSFIRLKSVSIPSIFAYQMIFVLKTSHE